MNAEREIIEAGVVVIRGNKIVAVGSNDLAAAYSAPRTIDARGGIIMPGMINTHTHASMTVFRSLADDVPNRLRRYIFPLENKMVSEEMSYLGALHGSIEMAMSGVTTIVDMYLFEECRQGGQGHWLTRNHDAEHYQVSDRRRGKCSGQN